ncbi:MAG: FeoB-associated Cys-rich membrane protein [Erysipelotrichaceae bacterium]|nr:FeoB-associated Cys-rich membrane protein [Erysipelotrichaceae bacterium]MBQ4344229.1 FeoB-associated Cys-rich membrane protein [Erysipelotrichaceae bacterium]
MNIKEILAVLVIAFILILAIAYIIKEKKNGTKCIGCPHAKSCGKRSCCSPD